ncbi:MAG: beta-1,6-N-acetylglucosaminyltransferase [Microlunatus sp.]
MSAPGHVRRLVRTLADGGAHVVVHIDARSDIEPFRETGSAALFLADRVKVHWGGWSQVQATLAMLRAGRESFPDATHFWLISGDTYPLRSVATLNAFLDREPRAQYINVVSMPSRELQKPLTRLSHIYVEHDRNSWVHRPLMLLHDYVPRPYRRGMLPYAGSQWWTITREAADLLLAVDVERDSFARLAKASFIPDEHYIQTLLGNSEFAESIRAGLMYSDWRPGAGKVPRVLAEDNITILEEMSGDAAKTGVGVRLVARKFSDQTADIADAIEERLWPLPLPAPASKRNITKA